MINIAIIGTGKLGTRLAEQLILDKVCDCLFLWNRSKLRLRGTIRSLDVWKQILGIHSEIQRLEWNKLSQIDVIVFAIKEHYDPRELIEIEELPEWLPHDLRHVGLSRDILLIKELCIKLRQYRGTILVLTNPVDVVSTFVQTWVPSATVLGAGLSLDEARSRYILSQMKNQVVAELICPLGGEHGQDCIPLFSLGSDSLQNEANRTRVKQAVNASSNLGVEIVKDLGYTLQDCAVVFSQDIQWLLGQRQDSFRSFSQRQHNACIGWPLRKSASGTLERFSVAEEELKALLKVEERIYRIFCEASREWFTPIVK
jgi:malate/lactate dehydrogenase